MSIPIWVTDPAGNNNPYLKIIAGKGPYFTWLTRHNPGGSVTIEQVINSTFTGTTLYDTSFAGQDSTNNNAIAIQDDTTNIYLITRTGNGTANYLKGGGSALWTLAMPVATPSLNHVAIDNSGNLLVLGPSATHVQRYSLVDGSFSLQVPTGGNASSYRINFCSDRENNIIVATMVNGPSGGNPASTAIAKYDSQGNSLWSTTFTGQSTRTVLTTYAMVRQMANAPNGDIYWDDFVSITCINGSTGATKWQNNYSNITSSDPILGGGSATLSGFGIDTDLAGAVYVGCESGLKIDTPNTQKSYSFGNVISYAQNGMLQQNISTRVNIDQIAVSSNSIFICADAGQLDGASNWNSFGWAKFSLSQDQSGNFTFPASVGNIANYTITGQIVNQGNTLTGLTPTNVWSQQVT